MNVDSRQLEPSSGVCLALLAAFCAALYLPGAFSTTLLEPEEARCAMVVEHMTQTGQYFVPYLDGKPYFDKPAPYFALAAAGRTVFAPTPWYPPPMPQMSNVGRAQRLSSVV